MADFQVVELFESINGEGRFAGELANFVYPPKRKKGAFQPPKQIKSHVHKQRLRHVMPALPLNGSIPIDTGIPLRIQEHPHP